MTIQRGGRRRAAPVWRSTSGRSVEALSVAARLRLDALDELDDAGFGIGGAADMATMTGEWLANDGFGAGGRELT
ncbi:hypothetical protein NA29_04160 [Pandoraea sputorum]|nr:hypothetical protein NA29_04160 [Pandoraea sputorum]BET12459.1 hypothetical protein THI4931_35010 [Pandoraea sputorum]